MLVKRLIEILEDDNVFLSGGAGVGKSFLTNELIREFRQNSKVVVALGSTGISAFNVGGVTLHSFFAFKRCKNYEELLYEDRKQRDKIEKLTRMLKQCDLLIIDEISMVSSSIMEMIYYRLTRCGFKGKILLVGDFFQLPPVNSKNDDNLFQDNFYAFSSHAWKDFKLKNVELVSSKRTDDKIFYEYLSMLRVGRINFYLLQFFKNMLIKKQEFMNFDSEYTLLCATNKNANLINDEKLKHLNTEEFVFDAQCEKLDFTLEDKAYEQWINSLNALKRLKIKIGARVIFCVNNKEENYYNGEQGIVKDILKDEEGIIVLVEKYNKIQIKLKAYEYTLEEYELDENEKIDIKIKAKFIQYPIKLAYAITIHKSQGMSIEKLICDIDNIFERGQLYVCLSRAINPKKLKITYNYNIPFEDYFLRVLKIDKEVKQFYLEQKFINLED